MALDKEASPGTPGDGYQAINERDSAAKQSEAVRDSAAFRDESLDAADVKLLPGTGGPDDTGDQNVPDDYDPTGHANSDPPEAGESHWSNPD